MGPPGLGSCPSVWKDRARAWSHHSPVLGVPRTQGLRLRDCGVEAVRLVLQPGCQKPACRAQRPPSALWALPVAGMLLVLLGAKASAEIDIGAPEGQTDLLGHLAWCLERIATAACRRSQLYGAVLSPLPQLAFLSRPW
jgi:hypothetical protein